MYILYVLISPPTHPKYAFFPCNHMEIYTYIYVHIIYIYTYYIAREPPSICLHTYKTLPGTDVSEYLASERARWAGGEGGG
jgi:hypothetical protein